MSAAIEQETHFSGELKLADLDRLRTEVLAGAEQTALQVELRADRRSGWPRLHGRITGSLALECRRCGNAYAHLLDLPVDLRLVEGEEEEKSLLAVSEPYCVQDDRLPLRELIEEEVLLALPMLARCESCENAVLAAPRPQQPEVTAERNLPFASLKQQLKTNRE